MYCTNLKMYSAKNSTNLNLFEHKSVKRKGQNDDCIILTLFRAPLGARTLDPNIKSVVLYQLS